MCDENDNVTPVKVKVKKITDYAILPMYATEGASGFDLFAYISNPDNLDQCKSSTVLQSGTMISLGTGLIFDIPKGYEMQIRSRSGMAMKGLIVRNQPGTVDSDYRGEVRILLFNSSSKPITIEEGIRVAQGVIAPVIRVLLEDVDVVSETERGEDGFGSSGDGVHTSEDDPNGFVDDITT